MQMTKNQAWKRHFISTYPDKDGVDLVYLIFLHLIMFLEPFD